MNRVLAKSSKLHIAHRRSQILLLLFSCRLSRQPSLVPRGRVAMNHALLASAIDRGRGRGQGRSLLRVVGPPVLLDRAAEARADAPVAKLPFRGLTHPLLGGLDVGHRSPLRSW